MHVANPGQLYMQPGPGLTCNEDSYRPKIESYWRYTNGEDCNSAIDLGTLTAGSSITHFNSNKCYNDNFGLPGKDVFYEFEVTQPIGITVSVCGPNGANFPSTIYLLSPDCNTIRESDSGSCSGGQSEFSNAICTPGTYYVVVEGNTLTDEGTFTLNIIENPGFTLNPNLVVNNISCNGLDDGNASLTPVGGAAPYLATWTDSNGDTVTSTNGGLLVENLEAGTYNYVLTDDDNCSAVGTINITNPAPIQFDLASTDVSCSGQNDGTAYVTNISGGYTPYTYLWNSTPIPQTTDSAIFLSAGTYTLTVTDTAGCQQSDTIAVNATTLILVNADSISNVSCNGFDDGYISVSTTGGQGPYTYLWSNGSTDTTLSGLAPNTYTVTTTDANNCSQSQSFTITEPTLLTGNVVVNNPTKCNGSSDGLAVIIGVGGTLPYSYVWSNGDNGEALQNVIAGNYSVDITDGNGCVFTENVVITEPTPLQTQISANDALCLGVNNGSVNLTVTGGTLPYTYTWSNFANTQNLNNITAGTYSVIVTDAGNCIITDSVTVGEQQSITLDFNVINPTCFGFTDGEISANVVGGTAPFSFDWSDGATGENRTDLGDGIYELTVTGAGGCQAIEQVVLAEPTELDYELTVIDIKCQNASDGVIIIQTSGATPPYTYEWSNNDENIAVQNGLGEGTYEINITDSLGCTELISVTLLEPAENPEDCDAINVELTIPNVFSPNNDGVNDLFFIKGTDQDEWILRVFNRWGHAVYKNDNYNNDWDGGDNPEGTYFYIIKNKSGNRSYKGNVQILR